MRINNLYESESRRAFIKKSCIVSVGFLGLQHFACNPLKQTGLSASTIYDRYGNLMDDREGIVKLPKGFSYKIITRQGEKMSDGLISPGKNDAMATFSGPDGKVIIIRNHEVSPGDAVEGAFGNNYELLEKLRPGQLYDYGNGSLPSLGGTTTMVYNEQTGEVETQYLSLAGTIRNCAGGPTPWNSWISCEETFTKKVQGKHEQNHGYNFEVPVSADMVMAEPFPLKDMGRFVHEAVAVDPDSGIVYQTEDHQDGLIYRFIPNESGKLRAGGKLQALAIKGQKSFDTRNWEQNTVGLNQVFDTEWINMENVDPEEDDLRLRGFEQGAARFARGEGMWYGNNEIYFACTSGGKAKQGQVFRYIPSRREKEGQSQNDGGKLELFAEPNDSTILHNCDNLTVAPWGDVILCEDAESPRIVGITPKGEIYHLAHNVGYRSEFAGSVFSPNGKTLFVNIQHAGLTLAITGPWKI